ncbi:unnamed protein product [Cylicocyclus nassatus]|uniref:Ig-like domain-containing protein n=1 Tax=Cylicocyclus nassatus TaxID=53992 RepID=A0AA36MDF2_CYLNA|nr:unnamed protein product [Cylicocyclus nassatus]
MRRWHWAGHHNSSQFSRSRKFVVVRNTAMPPLLPLLVTIALVHGGYGIVLSAVPRKTPTEMLLPIRSTTALMCEVVFSGIGEKNKAIWYRDGQEVGQVSSDTNAVFMDRNYTTEQPVPEVGFLIMSNISREDEGLYWCRHAATGLSGEVFALKVAYVEELPSEGYIRVEPKYPLLGEQVQLWCPIPSALPHPNVIWLLNGEPVSHTSLDAQPYPNGTLFIRHFSMVHNGVYECVISNFAAKTSTRVVIDSKHVSTRNGLSQSAGNSVRCSLLFRSSVLWFLVGCLVTSCSVLIYLLCALVLMRPSSRATLIPSMWARTNPLLGPGFRKVVVPVPDFISGSTTDSSRRFEDV